MSVGTTAKGAETFLGCEKGLLRRCRGDITIGDKEEHVQDERSGVPPEIRKWGEALASGQANPKQSPEEALADLEILEACLRSGEQGGKPIQLQYQQV